MKKSKYNIFTCVISIIVFVFALSCTGKKSINGVWEGTDGDGFNRTIEFSGKNNYILTVPWVNFQFHGTYYITDDTIELVHESVTDVLSFSRDGDAIIIDGLRLTRKDKKR